MYKRQGREVLDGNPGGARRIILDMLSDGAPRSVTQVGKELAARRGGEPRKRGAHSIVGAMARDGLIKVTQPLKGTGSAFKSCRVARLTPEGLELLGEETALGERQRQALTLLRARPTGLPVSELARRGIPGTSVKSLLKRGGLRIDLEVVERDPWSSETVVCAESPGRSEWVLTAEQVAAVESLEGAVISGEFKVALLHGVTGSGKTEVYLRVAQTVVARQRQVLILVPEIVLTPAVATSFRPVSYTHLTLPTKA